MDIIILNLLTKIICLPCSLLARYHNYRTNYREITQNQRRRRRRRRRRAAATAETGSADQQDESADYRDSKMDTVFSLVHAGIQKFAGIDSN